MKLVVLALTTSLIATAALAGQIGSGGVKTIRDNGQINGDSSWTITCSNGWGVVRRHGNAWTDDSANTYSDQLWSLSLEDFAERMCN